MKLLGLLSMVLIAGFLFVAVVRLHPVGSPLGNPAVFQDRTNELVDVANVDSMDDYFLRNGQRETGSNNIVTSVVFDYRAFDTLGEATVLFIVVSAISMLLSFLFGKSYQEPATVASSVEFPKDVSRIISFGSFLLFPIIMSFGIYLVLHGHLSPGGGFQGGAVMASATALLLVSSLVGKHTYLAKRLLSFFESVGLVVLISFGFVGLGSTFLFNFLANRSDLFLGTTVPLGSNPGYLNSAGLLPLLSLAVGVEVFCGISIILVQLYHFSRVIRQRINSGEGLSHG